SKGFAVALACFARLPLFVYDEKNGVHHIQGRGIRYALHAKTISNAEVSPRHLQTGLMDTMLFRYPCRPLLG
ncbi:MAG: hypothetical protein MJ175_03580, partial [Clostridia bacterium]|nr:hypothetical protein [Clostridia bacterium]